MNKQWYMHGYYGTIKHDVKAIYQYYLGWFDGNPANLNPWPPATCRPTLWNSLVTRPNPAPGVTFT